MSMLQCVQLCVCVIMLVVSGVSITITLISIVWSQTHSLTHSCVVHFVQRKADSESQVKSAETVSVEMLVLTCFLLWCVTVCGVTCV